MASSVHHSDYTGTQPEPSSPTTVGYQSAFLKASYSHVI